MKLARALWVVLAFGALAPAAHGAVITRVPGPQSATNGIVLGPDGNLWVADEFVDTVTRMTPSGTVLQQYPVGSNPTTVATGPGGRVWVSVTGDDKLTWFDATSSAPTTHDVPLSGLSNCGPVGLVAGPDGRIYVSQPTDGTCNAGIDTIGSVASNGSDAHAQATAGGDAVGNAYSLAVAQGKLFVPDFGGDVVRRMSLGTTLALESQVVTPAGSEPDAITSDSAGNLWVTGRGSGQLLRFPATQNGGSAQAFTPAGTLTSPAGVLASTDGHIYVTGYDSANLARFSPASSTFDFYPVPNSQPLSIIDGPSGDLFVTDALQVPILRFVNRAPKPGTATLGAPTASSLAASTTVDPGGNQTTVTFEYGPTSAYGSVSSAVVVPIGVDPAGAAVTLSGLQPGTEYHVRVRASNAEGTAVGPDAVLQTAAAGSQGVPIAPFIVVPTITAATLSASSFKVLSGKKGGSVLAVTLSAGGRVTGVITQKAKGVKKKSACVAPPRKKKKGQKSCTRVVTKGTLDFGTLAQGVTKVAVTGKIGKKPLPAGKYILTITVGSSSRSVPFAIKK